MKLKSLSCLAFLWIACLPLAYSQTPQSPKDSDLNEQVIFVPRPAALIDLKLETTVYTPATPGPWPLVVLNHGMAPGGHLRFQPRYRPFSLARFFLARGYLVVAPMREGFSNSTGDSVFTCGHATYARYYGQDISATIEFFIHKGDVRTDQILVVGHSAGGMVALGYGADEPRAKALINFAGGIFTSGSHCDWVTGMIGAAKTLGAQTHIPSLWIYTEDDGLFPPLISKPFFDAYHDVGAAATYKVYPQGGHGFANSSKAVKIWGADVEQFLRQVGLPADVVVSPGEKLTLEH